MSASGNGARPATSDAAVRLGRFEVVPAERRLLVEGLPVVLGSRAFDLLVALVARRDRVVAKEELIDVVWPGLVVEDNNLQVQISALRKVLGAQAIATVPGRGYRFTVAAAAPAERLDAVADSTAISMESATPVVLERATAFRQPAIGQGPLRNKRLLVADDNKVNRLLLGRSLELMGHEVVSADNGRTALQMLRAEPFDMLLLDLEMPELDGFGLLEQRAADAVLREVPVIVTSSLEGAAAVARCIELGADDYLHKPVNPVLLKARVGSSLERKHLRDRQRELLARLAPGADDGAFAGGAPAPGRWVDASLLVARLHDFDALSSASSAHETLELLSSWATLMLDAVEEHGGRVTQMTGDGIAAVFDANVALDGAPARHREGGDADDPGAVGERRKGAGSAPWSAVQSALEMTALLAQFNTERAAFGRAPLVLGIGIASGEVIVGRAGSPRRSADVCIGAASRRAAQLAGLADGGAAGAVRIDAATQVAVHGRVVTGPALAGSDGDAIHLLTA